jgi:hypothetical protein
MEYIFLIGAIVLAIPLLAVIALVRAGSVSRELERFQSEATSTMRDLKWSSPLYAPKSPGSLTSPQSPRWMDSTLARSEQNRSP